MGRTFEGAVGQKVNRRCYTGFYTIVKMNLKENGAAYRALDGAFYWASCQAVNRAVHRAVDRDVYGAVWGAAYEAVWRAVDKVVNEAVQGAVHREVSR